MKIKTSKLIGPALDWAVASYVNKHVTLKDIHWGNYKPSSNWAIGGLIIEREKIHLGAYKGMWDAWRQEKYTTLPCWVERANKPLIAAMRCFVASKLGDEVEIPEELVNG
jgi:hypothetical protein